MSASTAAILLVLVLEDEDVGDLNTNSPSVVPVLIGAGACACAGPGVTSLSVSIEVGWWCEKKKLMLSSPCPCACNDCVGMLGGWYEAENVNILLSSCTVRTGIGVGVGGGRVSMSVEFQGIDIGIDMGFGLGRCRWSSIGVVNSLNVSNIRLVTALAEALVVDPDDSAVALALRCCCRLRCKYDTAGCLPPTVPTVLILMLGNIFSEELSLRPTSLNAGL